MQLTRDWLLPVTPVPYVPTIGPVHPGALDPALFADVVRVALLSPSVGA
ncbi:hypothetical protein [Streptantibioticus ferralitis]|uniref:Uncharacterized protein n=1 Tax=Streptantibioticus ferralitis TaxID=236510 RepID=A0ABT5ZB78_9ACTN|nr:hypothetical protein [Streptantibioticus ferralitis]MDF2261098.1 hypothetical protein [Streptantibioticus ferralitis]